jgi:hypothetical protein
MNEELQHGEASGCSEIGTTTARLSALEDLTQRTFSALRGVWRKLDYLGELRSPDGEYEHWGLNRVHGEAEARRILTETHSSLYTQLLRTALPDLIADFEGEDDEDSAKSLVEHISRCPERMIPSVAPGLAPRHFSSIVLAVSLLRSAQQPANRRAA